MAPDNGSERQTAAEKDARAEKKRREAGASVAVTRGRSIMAIRDLSDILAIEAVPLSERALPANTLCGARREREAEPKRKGSLLFPLGRPPGGNARLDLRGIRWGHHTRRKRFHCLGRCARSPRRVRLAQPSRNPLRHLGRRGCWSGACNQPDARGEADRASAGRRARLCPCHPGAG